MSPTFFLNFDLAKSHGFVCEMVCQFLEHRTLGSYRKWKRKNLCETGDWGRCVHFSHWSCSAKNKKDMSSERTSTWVIATVFVSQNYRFVISIFKFSCKFSRYSHILANVTFAKITPSCVNAIFRPKFENISLFLKA